MKIKLNVVNLNISKLNLIGNKKIQKKEENKELNQWLWDDKTPIYWNENFVMLINKN